jgi:four helix bundle protein
VFPFLASGEHRCDGPDGVEQLPKGRGYLTDQLQRAATSIPLNIAEGAGEYSRSDKARFYRIARSATESSAIIDVCRKLDLISQESHAIGRESLLRIVAMLTRLVRNLTVSGRGAGKGKGREVLSDLSDRT